MNKVSASEPTIAPFELLTLPPHLDGSLIPHRYPDCGYPRLTDCNDMDAIQEWLADVAKTPATHKAYLLTAERCLLWSTMERGKPLSALTDEDAQAYGEFLVDPQPRDRWLCVGKPRRNNPLWRPFQAPMSPRSRNDAINILSLLWVWLGLRGYVGANPWTRSPYARGKIEKTRIAPGVQTDRQAGVITAIEWAYLELAIQEMEGGGESDSVAGRIRALFYLAYYGQIKPAEFTLLRTSAIRVLAPGLLPVWTLTLPWRPESTREVVLLPPAQRALASYLERCNTTMGTERTEFDEPLIASNHADEKGTSNLSRGAINAIAGPVFDRASVIAMRQGNLLAARRLSHGSLQWLAHAFAVHSAQRGENCNWVWMMIGSTFVIPPSIHPFLPPRTPFDLSKLLEGFEQLRGMFAPEPALSLSP